MLPRTLRRLPGETREEQSKRILRRHHDFMQMGDLTNAITLWGEWSPFLFRQIVARDGGGKHDFSKPSIVSAFMPKSGGTFIHNRMVADFGYGDYWWCLTDPKSPSNCFASAEALRFYTLGGFTCHTHMVPHPQILATLDNHYPDPIWVHIRDPRDVVLSSYYHYLGRAQGSGQTYAQRMQQIQQELAHLKIELGDINDYARQHLTFFLDWLTEWVTYSQSDPGRVFFTFFDELQQPADLFKRVFAEFDAKLQLEEITASLEKDRKRDKDEERENLSPAVRDELKDRIARQLAGFEYLDRVLGA